MTNFLSRITLNEVVCSMAGRWVLRFHKHRVGELPRINPQPAPVLVAANDLQPGLAEAAGYRYDDDHA